MYENNRIAFGEVMLDTYVQRLYNIVFLNPDLTFIFDSNLEHNLK